MNTKINEDYVSFEIAKLLKEKGFNESIETLIRPEGIIYHLDENSVRRQIHSTISNSEINIYSEDVSCPTLQMAMKWLREVHNIIICIEPHMYNVFDNKTSSYIFTYWTDDNYNEPYYWRDETNSVFGKSWSTYEEACEAAIKYCLTNLI